MGRLSQPRQSGRRLERETQCNVDVIWLLDPEFE